MLMFKDIEDDDHLNYSEAPNCGTFMDDPSCGADTGRTVGGGKLKVYCGRPKPSPLHDPVEAMA